MLWPRTKRLISLGCEKDIFFKIKRGTHLGGDPSTS